MRTTFTNKWKRTTILHHTSYMSYFIFLSHTMSFFIFITQYVIFLFWSHRDCYDDWRWENYSSIHKNNEVQINQTLPHTTLPHTWNHCSNYFIVKMLRLNLYIQSQTDRHTDKQIHTDRNTDTQADIQTDTQTHRHTNRQTHRHTDRHTHRQTHRNTDTDTDT